MSKIISLHWFYKTYHHGIIEEKKTTSDNNILGKTINIYNMVGQNIYSNTVNSESLKLELEAGIYTIELDNAYKKIIIN